MFDIPSNFLFLSGISYPPSSSLSKDLLLTTHPGGKTLKASSTIAFV